MRVYHNKGGSIYPGVDQADRSRRWRAWQDQAIAHIREIIGKAKKRLDDYIGRIPSDRVEFTVGRDLRLNPAGWRTAELFRLSVRRGRRQAGRQDPVVAALLAA